MQTRGGRDIDDAAILGFLAGLHLLLARVAHERRRLADETERGGLREGWGADKGGMSVQ